MGRYAELYLKDTSESNILAINSKLKECGIPYETHNGVLYGSFTSIAQLQEDARFMNEDPEGLKQEPHTERPITVEHLSQYAWNKIGFFQGKLNCMNDEEIHDFSILFQFAHDNPDLFDWPKSYNCDIPTLTDYGLTVKPPEKKKKLTKAQKIKKRLKDELGYNQRQVSVREDPCTLSWSFAFTIRDPKVIYKDIESFTKSVDSIDRCEASGEILSGGNTFTNIRISEKVKEEWTIKYLAKLKAVEDQFSESSGTRVEQFTVYKTDHGTLQFAFDGTFCPMNYHGLEKMALDMYIKTQTSKQPIKMNPTIQTTQKEEVIIAPIPSALDLLSKFDNIEVDYEARISSDDLSFCKETQTIYNELTDLLKLQLEYFEKKYQNGQANGAFKLNEHQGKYSVSTAYSSDKNRWDQSLKYTPLYSIAAIRNNLTKAKEQFINEIKWYFQNQYNISLSLDDLQSIDAEPDYKTILEYIFKETEGMDLFEAGVTKIKKDFLKAIWRPAVIKNKKIVFDDIATYDYFLEKVSLNYRNDRVKALLLAISYFERQSTELISELSKTIAYDNHYGPKVIFEPIEIDGLMTIQKARFYKNGNLEIHFTTQQNAQKFWEEFSLHQTLKEVA